MLGDGSENAKAGTAQVSDLFASYATRPPWEVAGVDYAVGTPAGTALKNPASISMAGVSVNASTHTITITGSNTTLDGYDFSLNGGWGVYIQGANHVTIQNSYFAVGSSDKIPIISDANSSDVRVAYNTIDGAGGSVDTLISYRGTNPNGPGLTAEYNWIKNAPGDSIQVVSGTTTVEYNLYQSGHYAAGAHADFVQFARSISTDSKINYNTLIITPSPGNVAGEGIQVEAQLGSTLTNTEVGHNVVIATGTLSASYLLAIRQDDGNTINGINVHDNYLDASGAYGFFYNGKIGGSNTSASGNIDLLNGKTVNSDNSHSGTATPTVPKPPVITTFSSDSGLAGDHITSDNSLTLTGTAAASSTVKIFDGSTQIGSVKANASGAWSFTTSTVSDGTHKFTATATSGSSTSATSASLSVTVDTVAPIAPTVKATLSSSGSLVVANVTGTAEANSTVKVFDGATQIGTATAGSNGAWTFTTGTLATGNHSFTAKAMDVAGNTGSASSAAAVTVSTPTSPPASTKPDAPVVSSFSEDSGVKGDGITNDNTITLTGTAAANSTIKVYDGSAQIGTVKAAANGAWSYTTSALTDAKHSLTATATNASGQTSTASAAIAITVDTTAPDAPTISTSLAAAARATTTSPSTFVDSGTAVNLKGVAEAKSSVAIYDGNTKIGTVTAGTDGSWSFSTSSLAAGQHTLTAKATDVAGNVGSASAAFTVNVTSPTPTPPSAPKIVSFSNDTGKVGDGITSDNTLKLAGTAAASSTVTVYDGTQKLGTVKSDSSGAWSFTTVALKDGSHTFTAKVTDSKGQTGAASDLTKVTVDTKAPGAPSLGVFTDDGKALNGQTKVADVVLKGTGEANSLIKLYDAGKLIGETTTKGDGTWSFDPGHLTNGDHKFSAIASDIAGNASTSSAAKAISVVDAPSSIAGIDLTKVYEGWNNSVVIKGTADAYNQIKIFDGSKEIGSVKANASGDWCYGTGSVSSNSVHTFSAKELDKSGQVVATSGNVVLGTAGANVLKGTSGDDIFIGNGNADTFVFAPNFGNDTIKDFRASGASHDVVQFSKSMFDNFADVLAHATQSGQDVVIASGSDSLTLKNTKLAALDKSDFHFA